MTRRFAALPMATALLTSAVLAAGPAAQAADPNYFSSCAKLTKKFPAGVAKSARAAAVQVEEGNDRPAATAKAKKVYVLNKARLDRDNDGTACETS